MPDALEEFTARCIEQWLRELPVEQLLKDIPVEQLLQGVSVEQRVQGVTVDELLAALSPEKRAALAQRIKEQADSPSPARIGQAH